MILICLLLAFRTPQIEPQIELNEESGHKEGVFLNYPSDVLMMGDLIFVVGGSFEILVFRDNEFVSSFGKQGQGPDEFANWPESIVFQNDKIEITEMFGWQKHFFSKDQVHLGKVTNERGRFVNFENARYKVFKYEEILTSHHLIQTEEGCQMGDIPNPNDLKIHLASFIILPNSNSSHVLIKRNGKIYLYNLDCDIEKTYQLKVGNLVREPQVDTLHTKLYNVTHDSNRTMYHYGLPVYDATMCGEVLWLLASNEWRVNSLREPMETWLFRVNLNTGESNRVKWHRVIDKIRSFNDQVVLISKKDVIIQVYKAEILERVFE